MRYHTTSYGGYGGAGGFGFGYALTPLVKKLLIANVVVFSLTVAIGPALIVDLFGFRPNSLLTRPWGFVTYMFVHGGFMHLFVNMLGLFFFGPPLEAKWGSREFLKFYVVAGMGGVLMSLFFQPGVAVIGASAAVYGVMLAFAMNWPTAPIYIWGIFPVQARWLLAFFFLMSLFSAFGTGGGGVAHFAHLGGLVTGFLYLKADWRVPTTTRSGRRSKRPIRRLAIVPHEEDSAESVTSHVPRETEDEQRLLDAVDQVLDKISEQGMASLTSAERRLLDEVSRKHRTN